MTIDVNYKNKKRYKTAKYPIRQPLFLMGLIWLLSKIMLIGKKYKIEKVNMEGLKPPYILLSNHMHFIDFEICAMATFPHRVNNVVNIDGYYQRPWLLELIGAICTRKFTMDMHLVKSIRRVLERGDILCMYPEARYAPCGINSFIPDSVARLVKRNKVPLVTVLHRGNYLYAPFWNFRNKRKSEHYMTMTQLLTPEDIERMSVEEIHEAIVNALSYDEYKYQKENNIKITEPYRAEGLHKVLYQCPHCKSEFKMASAGAEIFCTDCGKRWTMLENGELKANDGETEFSHVPDWFEWQRANVVCAVESGEYSFEDEVDVFSMPRCWRFEKLGKAKVIQNREDGFILEGYYNGAPYRIQRAPLQINSLHVEYDFPHIRRADCFDISTENDSFYCYPSMENVVTKLGFATEAIYQRALRNKRVSGDTTKQV